MQTTSYWTPGRSLFLLALVGLIASVSGCVHSPNNGPSGARCPEPSELALDEEATLERALEQGAVFLWDGDSLVPFAAPHLRLEWGRMDLFCEGLDRARGLEV